MKAKKQKAIMLYGEETHKEFIDLIRDLKAQTYMKCGVKLTTDEIFKSIINPNLKERL